MKHLFIIVSLIAVISPLKSESYKEVDCNSARNESSAASDVDKRQYKNDLKLKEEIGDSEVYRKWKIGREAICQYYSGKQFEGGSIRPMMQSGCNLRLNSEAKRFCLTGDPQCG